MKLKYFGFFAFMVLLHPVYIAAETGVYTSILQDFVKDDRVDYVRLCKDPRLERYISELSATDPDRLPADQDRLAFWINTYNAYTLKVVCGGYPIKSINDLHKGGLVVGSILNTTIWDKKVVTIQSRQLTLNEIEHKIIRPVFKDPRAHFALVCASKSCPLLRREAFEGPKLDAQLDDQGRLFLSDPRRNRIDVEKKIAYLSKIFDWYGKDFGKNKREVLLSISRFLPEQIASAIRSDAEKWKVEYLDYDWSLNE